MTSSSLADNSSSDSLAPPTVPSPPASGAPRRRITVNAASVRAAVVGVLRFLAEQWRWLVLGVIYFFGWYTPFTDHGTSGDGPLRWCWDQCYSISMTLGFELYVPIFVGIVIWSQRDALRDYWARIVSHYPPGHKKRQGSLIPLAIGCFLLFVSHLIEVKGVGVFALVLIAWGIVYRIYGPLMTRALATPLSLLLLMIPPPDHFSQDFLTHKVCVLCVKFAAALLNVFGMQASSVDTLLRVHGYGVTIYPPVCAGTNIAFFVVLILLTYHLCRRTDSTMIVLSFIVGIVLSFTMQVLRVAAVGFLAGPQIDLAQWLMSASLVSAILIAFVTFVTLQIMRISFLDRARVPHAVLRAARVTGKSMNSMTARPIDSSLSLAGRWWRSSERAIERFLKSITPKSKRKKRRW